MCWTATTPRWQVRRARSKRSLASILLCLCGSSHPASLLCAEASSCDGCVWQARWTCRQFVGYQQLRVKSRRLALQHPGFRVKCICTLCRLHTGAARADRGLPACLCSRVPPAESHARGAAPDFWLHMCASCTAMPSAHCKVSHIAATSVQCAILHAFLYHACWYQTAHCFGHSIVLVPHCTRTRHFAMSNHRS